MEEMVAAKQAVQDVLKISPEDIQLHLIHGMYTGHILDIRKTMMQERAVDRDQLLIDALRGVVNFLLQKGEGESSQFIGDHLEEIGNKVKTFWQDSKCSRISRTGSSASAVTKLSSSTNSVTSRKPTTTTDPTPSKWCFRSSPTTPALVREFENCPFENSCTSLI
jgi:hypothetical protein